MPQKCQLNSFAALRPQLMPNFFIRFSSFSSARRASTACWSGFIASATRRSSRRACRAMCRSSHLSRSPPRRWRPLLGASPPPSAPAPSASPPAAPSPSAATHRRLSRRSPPPPPPPSPPPPPPPLPPPRRCPELLWRSRRALERSFTASARCARQCSGGVVSGASEGGGGGGGRAGGAVAGGGRDPTRPQLAVTTVTGCDLHEPTLTCAPRTVAPPPLHLASISPSSRLYLEDDLVDERKRRLRQRLLHRRG